VNPAPFLATTGNLAGRGVPRAAVTEARMSAAVKCGGWFGGTPCS
jgi:hypothetical protein